MTTSTHTSLSVVSLSEIDGEPRVLDTELGKALGMARPEHIRDTIKEHREALEAFGGLPVVPVNPGPKGGRPTSASWLNEEQALYVTMHCRTERAQAVKIQVVKVFTAWRRGQLVSPVDAAIEGHLVSMARDISAVQATIAEHEDRISVAERDVADIKTVVKIVPAMFAIIERLNDKLDAPGASTARKEPSSFVTAFEILEMANYSAEDREAGTLQTITKAMLSLCAERGVACIRQSKAFGPGRLYLFPREIASEWLLGGTKGLDTLKAQITRMRAVRTQREARKAGRRAFQVVAAPGVTPDPVV